MRWNVGEILAIAAGCLFSISLMLSQLEMRQASVSAGVMLNLVFNNLVYGSFLVYVLYHQDLPVITFQGVIFAAGGGIAANVLGRTLNYQAVRRIGSARAVSLSLSQTLFAFLFSAVLLREIPEKMTIFGILLVIGGVFWLSREQVQRQTQTLQSSGIMGSEASGGQQAGLSFNYQKNPKQSVTNYQGIIFALLAGLAFSGADLSRKLSLMIMPSAILSSALGGLAALIVQTFIFTWRSGWNEVKRLSRKTVWLLFGAGLVGGLAVLTLNAALSFSSIVIVNSLYNIRVWVPIVLGPLLLGTEGKITRVLVFSTLLILVGTLIIVLR